MSRGQTVDKRGPRPGAADTPGILWPRFDPQEVGELLAVTGAVKDDVLDRETLAANLLIRLRKALPEAVERAL